MKEIAQNETFYTKKSPGKSPSYFFFSLDYKYIIKLVIPREVEFMKNILHSYYYYILQYPNTLLSKFYSFFGIQFEDQVLHFVIMENVMNLEYDINEVYDLKGSTYGRSVPEEEKMSGSAILKDLDIPKNHLKFTAKDKKTLMDQISRDCSYLESGEIMDYSFLVGVHYVDKSKFQYNPKRETLNYWTKDYGGILSSDMECIYFVGIIDFLTPYGWKKLMETSWKRMYTEESTLSAVNPILYRNRFENFVLNHCVQ